MAFDRPGAPGQRQAGHDGILIAADAAHKGAQVGQVVGPNVVHPPREAVTTALAHHLGEGSDVAGQGIQLWAAVQDPLEGLLLVGFQAGRLLHDPAGDLPGLELQRPGGRGGIGSELAQVPTHNLDAATEALSADLVVQAGSRRAALHSYRGTQLLDGWSRFAKTSAGTVRHYNEPGPLAY